MPSKIPKSKKRKIKRNKQLEEIRKRFNLGEEKSYLDYLKEKSKKNKYYREVFKEMVDYKLN